MSDKNRPYHRFAKIYDRMGGDRFSEKMTAYTYKLLKKHRLSPHTVLDLCCGTGTAALLMAEAGYSACGLDGSASMLEMARAKARYKQLAVEFYHQEVPGFKIKDGKRFRKFDMITCFYDSVNYLLTETELKKGFQAVANHLNPDGVFIFDMNTFHAFTHIWSKTNAGCHEDIAWIFETDIDKNRKLAELTATFFIRKGKLWEKFSEVHRERAYNLAVLRKLLRLAGFSIIGIYRCFKYTKPDKDTNRIAVIAKKKV